MAKKEPVGWITVNGQHVPLFEGESKQDAYTRAVVKHNEDVKNKQIAQRQEEADKLNKKMRKSNSDAYIISVSPVLKEAPELKKFYDEKNGSFLFTPSEYAKHKGTIAKLKKQFKDLSLIKESAEDTGLDEDTYILYHDDEKKK